MREETHPQKKICAICKRPIEQGQRPSVKMRNGEEVHIECYSKWEEAARRPTEPDATEAIVGKPTTIS